VPALAPEVLISRHYEKLRARADAEKLQSVLARAGLTVAGGHVMHGGHTATVEDCYAYKRAVREVYGDATYAFAKVNFVLGGCTCPDCAARE
jgi:hypothetical protein